MTEIFFWMVHYSSKVSILSFVLLPYIFFSLMPENTEPMPSDVLKEARMCSELKPFFLSYFGNMCGWLFCAINDQFSPEVIIDFFSVINESPATLCPFKKPFFLLSTHFLNVFPSAVLLSALPTHCISVRVFAHQSCCLNC